MTLMIKSLLFSILFFYHIDSISAQNYCTFETDGTGKSIGMKIKMIHPCNWTKKDINDSRIVKNFTCQIEEGYLITSNLVLIPTPKLLNKAQFEFAMSTNQLMKMMAGKGEVQEINWLQFDNFDGAELQVKTIKNGIYYYSLHFYMYSNKGLMVINYFVTAESDAKALSAFNKNKSLFRKLVKKTVLLNPVPNQGVTTGSTKESLKEWTKSNLTNTDKSISNDIIEGSLYRNTKYSFRIRFFDNWEIRKGDSKTTIIKSVQPDSGKSILVLVSDYPNFKLPEGEMSDKEVEETKKILITMFKEWNMTPEGFKIIRGYLNNFPATISTFTIEEKSQTTIISYKYKQITCFKDGFLYNLTISMPQVFWTDKEDSRLNRVLESFVFE